MHFLAQLHANFHAYKWNSSRMPLDWKGEVITCNYQYLCDPRCYWGCLFENLATENSREMDGDDNGIDANVEFYSAIKTKLSAHSIIMGAEMDCCDSTDGGRKFYI